MPNFNYIIPGSPPPEPLLNRVARDSMGDINGFRPGVLQGQGQYNSYLQQHRDQIRLAPSSLIQQPPSLPPSPTPSPFGTNHQNQQPSPYQTTQKNQSSQQQQQPPSQSNLQPMKDWETLPQDFIEKIVELKRLLYRHSNTFPNPEIIIQGAKHFAMNGDSSFLDEKLAYLRSVDAIIPPPPPSQQDQQQTGQDNFVV